MQTDAIKRIETLRKKHVTKALKDHEARLKDVSALMASVRKNHGKEAIRLMSADDDLDVPCVSLLRQELDDWLTGSSGKYGTGRGLPIGRIIEIYGPESSGKTTLTLHAIAALQKQGHVCAFVDAEHAFDPKWARVQGVNTDELLISQPDNGEQALQITEDLVRSKKVGLIVVDSVAALVPQAELDADMKKNRMGLQAAMMSKALRKLKGLANKSGCTIIFINQIRMKLGVMFGNPETTPGGQALKFYASIRIDVRRVVTLKRKVKVKVKGETVLKERAYGAVTKAKTVKNKCAAPGIETKFLIEFEKGITEIGDHL